MSPPTLNHIDLLVVDSESKDYRKLSIEALEAELVWHHADDGHQALQIASGKHVSLWFSNMQLADMSGIELLRLIKSVRPAVPFYLVSNHYSADEERKARAAGAAGYLSKPADHTWFEICRTTLARIKVRAGPSRRVNASRVS